jgi:hypothetical protein
MKTIRATWMAAAAMTAWMTGRISEAECRRRVNAARALIGRPPVNELED